MRILVTGANGFIGRVVVRRLVERGDRVVAIVRDPDGAGDLTDMGVELHPGDLGKTSQIVDAMRGADAAIHLAGSYRVGIPASERPRMRDANVGAALRVLDAASSTQMGKIVHVSTVNVFGNTHGEVVDETYERPGDDYLSYYDETKYLSHQVAKERIAKGVPIVIVQPGGVYGPGDHSEVGNVIDQTRSGKLKALPFAGLGLNLVYVDDVAGGVLLALDKGQVGESYVLGGQITTMREIIETLASVSGKKAPKRAMPTPLLRAMTPLGPVVGKVMNQGPNLGELIKSADGVTFWAKHDKAMAQLGYSPRGLEQGLRDTLAAEGKLPAGAAA